MSVECYPEKLLYEGDSVGQKTQAPDSPSKVSIKRLARVYHVGLYPEARPPTSRWTSYEGIGLSISLDPKAWIKIAKLGGLPLVEMHRRDGQPGRFLDWHESRDIVLAWGVAASLVRCVPAWLVCYENDEVGEVEMMYFDRKQAQKEMRGFEEAGMEATLGETSGFVADGALAARLEEAFGPIAPEHGAVLAELANRYAAAAGLDGVWWDDDNDPDFLSAPRGVIIPERLDDWVATHRP